MWMRWVDNYRERTMLMINLFFSIASQADSRTNLEVADLTAKIAVDAQRDSSSMITIAAVTMVFLPGTFISVGLNPDLGTSDCSLMLLKAIFSMAFFNAGTDEHGKATLEVSPLWWYFPTITIPLTILVFVIWEVWRRKRQATAGLAGKQAQEQPPTTKQSSRMIRGRNNPGSQMVAEELPNTMDRAQNYVPADRAYYVDDS